MNFFYFSKWNSFSIEQNDPALENVELENTLIENEREATIKTQKVCRISGYKIKNRVFCFCRFSKNFHKLIQI
jgi:hypothetical protein